MCVEILASFIACSHFSFVVCKCFEISLGYLSIWAFTIHPLPQTNIINPNKFKYGLFNFYSFNICSKKLSFYVYVLWLCYFIYYLHIEKFNFFVKLWIKFILRGKIDSTFNTEVQIGALCRTSSIHFFYHAASECYYAGTALCKNIENHSVFLGQFGAL